MSNVTEHPLKYAKSSWNKMTDDEFYLLDAPYAEIGGPNGPPEDYHVITLSPVDTLVDCSVSIAYFSDGFEMPLSTKPQVPLMRSWKAKPLPDLDFYDAKYPEWKKYFFRNIDMARGINMQIRAYRRMEQWNINIHDEIGKRRIIKDVDDAYRRLIPDGKW